MASKRKGTTVAVVVCAEALLKEPFANQAEVNLAVPAARSVSAES